MPICFSIETRKEIGESYFDYLAGLHDLVLIMDESHRYRASAGIRAINELKPVLGLELTATPFVETTRGPVSFKNVIYDYPLGRAMQVLPLGTAYVVWSSVGAAGTS